jgi:hypothetical protein
VRDSSGFLSGEAFGVGVSTYGAVTSEGCLAGRYDRRREADCAGLLTAFRNVFS